MSSGLAGRVKRRDSGRKLIVSRPESSTLGDRNPEKSGVCMFFATFGPHEKPLRISITVIHLVLKVEFQIDMLPHLRKTGLKRYYAPTGGFADSELSVRRFRQECLNGSNVY